MADKIQVKRRRHTSSTVKTQIAPTPRPWVVKYDDKTGLAMIASPVKSNGNRDKVTLFPMMMPNEVANANAELICRAVNSHDALVEAARHWSVCDFPDEIDFRCEGCNAARTALAMAEIRDAPSVSNGNEKV